jgi:hypothetical protein
VKLPPAQIQEDRDKVDPPGASAAGGNPKGVASGDGPRYVVRCNPDLIPAGAASSGGAFAHSRRVAGALANTLRKHGLAAKR